MGKMRLPKKAASFLFPDFYTRTPEKGYLKTYMAGAILFGLWFIVTLTLTNKSITYGKE